MWYNVSGSRDKMYINTDNIIFDIVWDDFIGFNNLGDFFEIKVTAYNSFIKVNNFNFYMTSSECKKLSKMIYKYIQKNETIAYENKSSADNNEINIEIKPADVHGHVIIILKIENVDNNDNKNFAQLAIETEIGLLENFSKNILELINSGVGHKVSLNKEL